MNKLIFGLIIIAMGCMAQSTVAAQDQGELTWYGLDYTQVKFIGLDSDFNDLPKIREHYFAVWNQLFLTESSKYDIKGALGVDQISYEIEKAIDRSKVRDMSGIVQTAPYELGRDQLAEVLKAYVNASESKTGALFIMETLNKMETTSTMWLVVFDVSTSKIHHLKRYSGAPGGFGFRNYWARPCYNVITSLKESPQKPF